MASSLGAADMIVVLSAEEKIRRFDLRLLSLRTRRRRPSCRSHMALGSRDVMEVDTKLEAATARTRRVPVRGLSRPAGGCARWRRVAGSDLDVGLTTTTIDRL